MLFRSRRRRRRPPARIVQGKRIRFDHTTNQAILTRAALSGRTYEQQAIIWLRQQVGI